MGDLSAHFNLRELACRCGCKTPLQVKRNLKRLALEVLEPLRELAGGVPLYITSGHRCSYWNARVGGVDDSQHLYGLAADVTSKHVAPAALADLAEKVPALRHGGIGRYPGFSHVDIRGYRARW